MYEQFQNIMKMGPFGQIMVSSFRISYLWPYSLNSSLKQDSKGDSAQAVLVVNTNEIKSDSCFKFNPCNYWNVSINFCFFVFVVFLGYDTWVQ